MAVVISTLMNRMMVGKAKDNFGKTPRAGVKHIKAFRSTIELAGQAADRQGII